ncbi:cuticle protein 10.9-like [Uloborus diversus]|uniref:cuticle protein 10.9-like n=1 Tax=Uloborus diversus TaxID=327109 RepID=UPI00240A314A|nr:cuticle protein 10.9-like [Uloborus diversus]
MFKRKTSTFIILVLTNFATNVLCIGHPSSNLGEYGGQNIPPKPYAFNYHVADDHGNVQFRREQADSSGIVSGSYGYMNINGLYRTVDYISDKTGFKAQVKTNEPGVGTGPGPADVEIKAKPVPAGLQDMYQRNPMPSLPSGYPGKKG